MISIHALREEGDHVADPGNFALNQFLSTPSARRATQIEIVVEVSKQYFYPRPPRGGRPAMLGLVTITRLFLSTPSARRATGFSRCTPPNERYFYPRPPRGGRLRWPQNWHDGKIFLSTPSARRATAQRGGFKGLLNISIHALREEGDSGWLWGNPCTWNFYPRPPRGGRLVYSGASA